MNITELAKEAGLAWVARKRLERIAALVRAEALEEAAKVCDDYAAECAANENWEAEDVSLINAAAIRGMK
jgi:hypothetical protein